MSNHTAEALPIATGVTTTWGTSIIAFSIAVTPLLHVLALMISIVVGLLTAWWTYRKICAMDAKADAIVAAAAVEAQAELVAKALEVSKGD